MIRDGNIAMELVSAGAVNTGAVLTPATVFQGNSLQIRSTINNLPAYLLWPWTYHNTAGNVQLNTPRMHDAAQGLKYSRKVTDTVPAFYPETPQILFPLDTLNLQINGSGSAVSDTAHLLIYYLSIQGIKARLADQATIEAHGDQMVTIQTTITGAASGTGAYVGQVRLGQVSNTLWQDTDYAWLGYATSVETPCVRITGPDFGNLGIGGPGTINNQQLTRRWFTEMHREYNKSCIPVFNSNNLGSMMLDVANASNAVSPTIDLFFCRLDAKARTVV
jgi:hypothetical protein